MKGFHSISPGTLSACNTLYSVPYAHISVAHWRKKVDFPIRCKWNYGCQQTHAVSVVYKRCSKKCLALNVRYAATSSSRRPRVDYSKSHMRSKSSEDGFFFIFVAVHGRKVKSREKAAGAPPSSMDRWYFILVRCNCNKKPSSLEIDFSECSRYAHIDCEYLHMEVS